MISSRRTAVFLAAVVLVAIVLAITPALAKGPPPDKPGGGEPVEVQGNNMSFPVIATDGFAITPITATQFTVPYAGTYPGLTADEIAWLEANGPWYAQKTEGNTWQAEWVGSSETTETVSFVNWGDNIESVNPALRRPFRLEVTLYKGLETTMTAYTMAELEYPSSSTELQGTNTTTYGSSFATMISNMPKLVVQYLGPAMPTEEPEWGGTKWGAYTIIPVSFAPELNVGGRYIFGASEGGWKPDKTGFYRITFYIPAGSSLSLAEADIDNFPPAHYPHPEEPVVVAAEEGEDGEGGVATPVVVPGLNLTYVDVQVVAKGGGGRP